MKNMKLPKTIGLRTFLVGIFASILFVSCLFYVFAATPTETFWISGGIYPNSVTYTLWREGSNYFAKDANGYIEFNGSNATTVIMDCLGDDRTLFFKQGTYVITAVWPSIELKDLTNIQLIAESGTVFLKDQSLGYVRQILEIDNCSNVIINGIIFNQNEADPSHLTDVGLGLQWIVRIVGGSSNVLVQNCGFINGEENGLVLGVSHHVTIKNCYFDNCHEHPAYTDGGTEDATFENCEFLNYGKDLRGYLKIDAAKNIRVIDSYFEPNEDGQGNNASSYAFVIGSQANNTLFENCIVYNSSISALISGDYNTIRGGAFERGTFAETRPTLEIGANANFTLIDDVKFVNWTYRIIVCDNSFDTIIQNCYFTGGVSSSGIRFGTRTTILSCWWCPNTVNGVYGINHPTATGGIIDGCHIPNSTLTFNFPSGVIWGENIFNW